MLLMTERRVKNVPRAAAGLACGKPTSDAARFSIAVAVTPPARRHVHVGIDGECGGTVVDINHTRADRSALVTCAALPVPRRSGRAGRPPAPARTATPDTVNVSRPA